MKEINVDQSGTRLDIFLANKLKISRSQIQKMIEEQLILVNGHPEKSNKILTQNDSILVFEKHRRKLSEIKLPVKIIFENKDFIVVDKAPNQVVYSSPGHETGTIQQSLKKNITYSNDERAGVVHRLDKDTSGLLIFAKNHRTELALKKQFKERKIKKKYFVLVWGKVQPATGLIRIDLSRSQKDRKKIMATASGRHSETTYEVIKYYENYSLISANILTGRTHQIRVHFASIGFPVVGDRVYGKKGDMIMPRQFLHAGNLSFTLFGKDYSFDSPLPADLSETLIKLEEHSL